MPTWSGSFQRNWEFDHRWEEPLTYECDVVYRFEILSDQGRNIRNIMESQFNKPSETIRHFTPEQREEINKMIDHKLENFANEVQKWITEEFAPTIQGWLTEQFVHTLKIEVDKDKLKEE